jgi:Domain of unknown function (DUF5655)
VAKATWTCPDCSKGFARPDQPHSCRVAEDAFALRPDWMRDAAQAIAKALPGARVEPNTGGWHYAGNSTFAAAKPKAKALRIEFFLDRELGSPRIVKLERLGPTRLAHHVDLTGPPDAELLKWLKAAYELRK